MSLSKENTRKAAAQFTPPTFYMQHDSYPPSEKFVNKHMNSYRRGHFPVYTVNIIVKLMFCDGLLEKSVRHKGGVDKFLFVDLLASC